MNKPIRLTLVSGTIGPVEITVDSIEDFNRLTRFFDLVREKLSGRTNA